MFTLDDYRKPTGFSGGIANGGGDTGSDALPQLMHIGKKLTVLAPDATLVLPKGMIVFAFAVLPLDTVPGAGTVDAGPTGTPDAWMADVALTAASRADLVAPVYLSADTTVIINSTGLTGDVFVAFEVVQPNIRP